jgi:hypothetical protein
VLEKRAAGPQNVAKIGAKIGVVLTASAAIVVFSRSAPWLVPGCWFIGAFVFVRAARGARLVGANLSQRIWAWFALSWVLLGIQYCLFVADPENIVVGSPFYPLTPILNMLATVAGAKAVLLTGGAMLSSAETRRKARRCLSLTAVTVGWIPVADINVEREAGRQTMFIASFGLLCVALVTLVFVTQLVPNLLRKGRLAEISGLLVVPVFAIGNLLAVLDRERLWSAAALSCIGIGILGATHVSARTIGSAFDHRVIVTKGSLPPIVVAGVAGLCGVAAVAYASSWTVRVAGVLIAVSVQTLFGRAYEHRATYRRFADLRDFAGLRSRIIEERVLIEYRPIVRLHDGAVAGVQTVVQDELAADRLELGRHSPEMLRELSLLVVEDAAKHLHPILLLLEVDEPFVCLHFPAEILEDPLFVSSVRQRTYEVDLTGLLITTDVGPDGGWADGVRASLAAFQECGAWTGVSGSDSRSPLLTDADFQIVTADHFGEVNRSVRRIATGIDSKTDLQSAKESRVEFGSGAIFGAPTRISRLVAATEPDTLSEAVRLIPARAASLASRA